MDEEEKRIVEEIGKRRDLNEKEKYFVMDVANYSKELIAYLLSVKQVSKKLGKYTTEFALTSIIMLVANNRDEMFSMVENIRKSLMKLDKEMVKR